MIGKISICLIVSMIFVNVYAEDYSEEVISTLSKTNEFYIVTAHIDGNKSTQGDKNHPPEVIPKI